MKCEDLQRKLSLGNVDAPFSVSFFLYISLWDVGGFGFDFGFWLMVVQIYW